MKKMSLQWRLTCIITLYIAVICGCVTMLVYKNGVYYMDSLQEAVDTRGDDQSVYAEEYSDFFYRPDVLHFYHIKFRKLRNSRPIWSVYLNRTQRCKALRPPADFASSQYSLPDHRAAILCLHSLILIK